MKFCPHKRAESQKWQASNRFFTFYYFNDARHECFAHPNGPKTKCQTSDHYFRSWVILPSGNGTFYIFKFSPAQRAEGKGSKHRIII